MKRKLRTPMFLYIYRASKIRDFFKETFLVRQNTLANFYLFTIVFTFGGKTLQLCFSAWVLLHRVYLLSFCRKKIFNHNILTAFSLARNVCVSVWSTNEEQNYCPFFLNCGIVGRALAYFKTTDATVWPVHAMYFSDRNRSVVIVGRLGTIWL